MTTLKIKIPPLRMPNTNEPQALGDGLHSLQSLAEGLDEPSPLTPLSEDGKSLINSAIEWGE
jgi:hypothetical protein